MVSEHSGFFFGELAKYYNIWFVLSSSFKQVCVKVHTDLNETQESTCPVKKICVWHY